MVRGVRGITRCKHVYQCMVIDPEGEVMHIHECESLQVIMRKVRDETGHKFKIPHGNRVRAIMLEQGICHIIDPFTDILYNFSVRRWADEQS